MGEVAPRGPLGARQVADSRVREGAAGGDGPGEEPQPLALEASGQACAAEDGVLLGQRLLRAGEFEQYARVGADVGLLDAGERAVHGERRRDGAGVLRVGRVPSCRVVEYGLPQRAEALGTGDEGLQAPRDGGGQFLAVGDGAVVTEPQRGHRPVGAGGEPFVVTGPVGVPGSGPAHGIGTLGLQRGDGCGQWRAQFGVDPPGRAQPGHVLCGADGGVAPQAEEGDDGHHEQADDLGAHGPGACVPPPRPWARAVRQRSEGALDVFVRGWSGVRAPAAAVRRRHAGAGGRYVTGWAHGLLARYVGRGTLRRRAGQVRRRPAHGRRSARAAVRRRTPIARPWWARGRRRRR